MGECVNTPVTADDITDKVRWGQMTIHGDPTASVIFVEPPFDSMGPDSEVWILEARKILKARTAASDLHYELVSDVSFLVDDKIVLSSQTPKLMGVTIVCTVLVFSAFAFRSVVLGPRLLLTIVLTLSAVYGAAVVWFIHLGHQPDGLMYLVPVVCTPIVIGLTLDYDLFLIGRIYEYRRAGYSTGDAVVLGLEKTGGIITTAGLIMLATFMVLLLSSNPVVFQLGFILSVAVAVDTFIVRTLFVPSVMLIAVDYNWWPSRMPPVTRSINKAVSRRRRSTLVELLPEDDEDMLPTRRGSGSGLTPLKFVKLPPEKTDEGDATLHLSSL